MVNSLTQSEEKTCIDRKRKRDSITQNHTMPKHQRSNYYAILDNDNCNQEYLEKFKNHVQGCVTPNTSKNSTQNISTRVDNQPNKESAACSNQNKNKKVPPINTVNLEPNEIVEFLKIGLNINEFKIKEFKNKKSSLFLSSITDYDRVKAYFVKTNTNFLHSLQRIPKQNLFY